MDTQCPRMRILTEDADAVFCADLFWIYHSAALQRTLISRKVAKVLENLHILLPQVSPPKDWETCGTSPANHGLSQLTTWGKYHKHPRLLSRP